MTDLRAEIIEDVKLRLGAGMVDVELDPAHYLVNLRMALRYYKQRSSNAQIEAFVFIEVQPGVATYSLPDEIQEIREVLRNNLGNSGGTGAYFDPFGASFTNNIYMIQNPGLLSTGGNGVLATYDMAVSFQKLTGRMFGQEVQYVWDSVNKKITFQRRFTGPEEIGLSVYMLKPDDTLFKDVYARPWIEDMTLALCKINLGEGRGKFTSYAGPQGGVTMNGPELKAEGQAMVDKLYEDLKLGRDSGMGYGFVIG
jgi:hypothetical protein